MDELLRQALEPVLRDLRGAGIGLPRIGDDDWTGDEQKPSAMLWGADGSGSGLSVDRHESPAERVAAAADQVQEWTIETLWGRAPTNWPPCPQHPGSHPMRATTGDAVAVWICPVDTTVSVAIGSL